MPKYVNLSQEQFEHCCWIIGHAWNNDSVAGLAPHWYIRAAIYTYLFEN